MPFQLYLPLSFPSHCFYCLKKMAESDHFRWFNITVIPQCMSSLNTGDPFHMWTVLAHRHLSGGHTSLSFLFLCTLETSLGFNLGKSPTLCVLVAPTFYHNTDHCLPHEPIKSLRPGLCLTPSTVPGT